MREWWIAGVATVVFSCGVARGGDGVAQPEMKNGQAAVSADDVQARYQRAADYSAQFSGRAVLVMRGGKVEFERYDNNWSEGKPHPLASGTKSFSGVMAMLAVQDGLMTLDERVSDTITEWQKDERKNKITVRHLLTLSSGLEAGPAALESRGGSRVLGDMAGERAKRKGLENAPPPPENLAQYSVSDQVAMKHDAGTKFEYGPTHFYVLCELVNRKLAARAGGGGRGGAEASTGEYLRARVFDAIGIKNPLIGRDRAGNPNLPGGCLLTAREWAKFGQFVLDKGSVKQADGSMRELLKPELLAECFKPSATNARYGLTWWLPAGGDGEGEADTGGLATRARRQRAQTSDVLGPDGKPVVVYMAAGLGKQRLYVLPQFDLVVVRFAEATRAGQRFDDREFLGRVLGRE